MAKNTVVLGFFQSEAEADDAVAQMKEWDKWDDDVKLNAIGVLALDDKGKIKTHKLGKRSVGKGAGIGLLLAIIAPPTLLAGVIGGGVLGALHPRGSASRAPIGSASPRTSPVVGPRSASSSRKTRRLPSRPD